MTAILNRLDGYKTYIGAAIIFVAGGLHAIGKIDDMTYQMGTSFGTAVTIVGIRSALAKLKP